MKEIKTEIEIAASAQTVWASLTDFQSYPNWNPFIQSVAGRPTIGSQLTVVIAPPGGKKMTFKPTVTQSQSPYKFQWLGHLSMPKLFDGIHTFEIHPIAANRVRFIHQESFSGLLVPLLWKTLNTQTREGFHQMNRSLKQQVEST